MVSFRLLQHIFSIDKLSVVSLMLVTLQLISSNFAYADIQRRFQLNSEPEGAVVCNKVLKRETCLGQTPFSIDLRFNNSNESKKYVFYKLGYEPLTLNLSVSSNEKSIKLLKTDLFPDPSQLLNRELTSLQRSINTKTHNVIYNYSNGNDQNFQLIGKLKAVRHDDQTALKLNLIVNNHAVLKDIKKASRIKVEAKKHQQLMKALNTHGIFAVFDVIKSSVDTLPIDVIEFGVTYSSTHAVLDSYTQESQYSRKTGSYCSGDYCYDTFTTYTAYKDVTVVKDRDITVDYVFLAEPKKLESSQGQLYSNLSNISVYTNDTPDNDFQKIEIVSPLVTP